MHLNKQNYKTSPVVRCWSDTVVYAERPPMSARLQQSRPLANEAILFPILKWTLTRSALQTSPRWRSVWRPRSSPHGGSLEFIGPRWELVSINFCYITVFFFLQLRVHLRKPHSTHTVDPFLFTLETFLFLLYFGLISTLAFLMHNMTFFCITRTHNATR